MRDRGCYEGMIGCALQGNIIRWQVTRVCMWYVTRICMCVSLLPWRNDLVRSW